MAEAQPPGKRKTAEEFETVRCTWGESPERAVFQNPSARKFFQTHSGQPASPPVGTFVLAVTAASEGEITTWDCELPGPEGDAITQDLVCQTLRILGRQLRASIVRDCVPTFSVRGIDRQVDFSAIVALAMRDVSKLGKFIRSLCCGDDAIPSEKEFRENDLARKRLMSSWVVTQLLIGRQGGSSGQAHLVGPLMSFMSWGQTIMDSKPFSEATRALCLSAQPATVLKAMRKRGQALLKTWEDNLRRGDFLVERLDNIRFSVRVKITGESRNLELTQRSVQVVSREHYRALGVGSVACWNDGPSREEVRQDDSIFEGFTTKAAARHLMAKYDSLLTLALELGPMVQDSQEMLVAEDSPDEEPFKESRRGSRHEDMADDDLSDDEDLSDDVIPEADDAPLHGNDAAETVTAQPDNRWRIDRSGTSFILRRRKTGARVCGSSDLKSNNAMMMPILDRDFSKGQTLEAVSFTASQWRAQLMAKDVDDDWQDGEVDCPLESARVPLLVDGKPCYQAQLHYVHPRISIARDTFFSCGGWHLVKVARKHKCRLFEWLLLPLIKLYGRDTLGRIIWFLDPSDPRQCSNECRAILVAIHVSASIAYRESLEGNQPSVQGLRDFMRERAMTCPLARGVLSWCRSEAAIEAIQESAGDRDAELYFGLLPVMGMLFTCTHATQYSQLVWEELVRRQTLSAAERAIFDEIIFARTAAGTSVFSDYWVEVTNRFLRHHCGRSVRGNEDSFLDFINAVLLDMENLQARGGVHGGVSHVFGSEDEASQSSDHEVLLGKVFATTLAAIHSVNVWGPGKITPLARRKGGKRTPLDAASYVTIDGLAMRKGWYSWLLMGEDKMSWFRETALKTDGWETGEGRPNIDLVAALKQTSCDEARAEWTKMHSCDEDDISRLGKAVSNSYLQGEIRRLDDLLRTRSKMTLPKPDLIKRVCALRLLAQSDASYKVVEEPQARPDEIDIQCDKKEAREMMDHPLMQ